MKSFNRKNFRFLRVVFSKILYGMKCLIDKTLSARRSESFLFDEETSHLPRIIFADEKCFQKMLKFFSAICHEKQKRPIKT